MSDNYNRASRIHKAFYDCLLSFVQESAREIKDDIYEEIRKELSLGTQPRCNQCTNANITPCGSFNSECKFVQHVCTFHVVNGVNQTRPCPNKVCDRVVKKLRNLHPRRSPNFKDSDATRWCDDGMEIIKCFYISKEGTLDVIALLSVIKNCKCFKRMKKVDDFKLFEEARKARNKHAHPETFDYSDSEMLDLGHTLMGALNDKGALSSNPAAKRAVQVILKILREINPLSRFFYYLMFFLSNISSYLYGLWSKNESSDDEVETDDEDGSGIDENENIENGSSESLESEKNNKDMHNVEHSPNKLLEDTRCISEKVKNLSEHIFEETHECSNGTMLSTENNVDKKHTAETSKDKQTITKFQDKKHAANRHSERFSTLPFKLEAYCPTRNLGHNKEGNISNNELQPPSESQSSVYTIRIYGGRNYPRGKNADSSKVFAKQNPIFMSSVVSTQARRVPSREHDTQPDTPQTSEIKTQIDANHYYPSVEETQDLVAFTFKPNHVVDKMNKDEMETVVRFNNEMSWLKCYVMGLKDKLSIDESIVTSESMILPSASIILCLEFDRSKYDNIGYALCSGDKYDQLSTNRLLVMLKNLSREQCIPPKPYYSDGNDNFGIDFCSGALYGQLGRNCSYRNENTYFEPVLHFGGQYMPNSCQVTGHCIAIGN